jgi:GDPmannose 4,6-dehydratase
LSDLLEKNGIFSTGITRSSGVNISSYHDVEKLVKEIRPDYIFHLAAHSTTRHEAWIENHDTIVKGTHNVLESVRNVSQKTRIFIAGSGLQFVNRGVPIKETDPFFPGSSYALSRIQAAYAARYYRLKGLHVYIGYLFNHDSPLRSEEHINMKIIRAAQRIAGGSAEKLIIGDPSVEKEFGFAGDIVQAIWKLVNQDVVFETVIGTGKSYTIMEWIKLVFGLYGIPVEGNMQPDPNYVAPFRRLVSDPSLAYSLDWRPETTIEELAKMMCRE